MKYKCDKCAKHFVQKNDFRRHQNRKKPCIESSNLTPDILQEKVIQKTNLKNYKNEYKCNFCFKYFTRKDNLERHLSSRCEIKLKKDNEKEEIFKKLLSEMKSIKEQNEELKSEIKNIKNKKIKNINNGTINNTNNTLDQSNNINNYNIQLVAYGKEDYDKLTEKEYKIIINKGFKSVQEAVKSLHFNKNRPENHNIYISNIRDNYVMIYEGNKWELRNRKETIEELYIAKKDILVDKFDEKINF